jgi:isopentenyl-diphosphate delta-isomerase
MEEVILVDKNDKALGKMEKMEAHLKGVLHRAFSVFIFNSDNKLVLQQRSLTKYHSPGLWTNTCCSHPRYGETIESAVHRRLREEMGFDCDVERKLQFVYKAQVGNGLTEHELDHVFFGFTNIQPVINAEEVHDWKYMSMEAISADMKANPEVYTVWFRIIFEEVMNQLG